MCVLKIPNLSEVTLVSWPAQQALSPREENVLVFIRPWYTWNVVAKVNGNLFRRNVESCLKQNIRACWTGVELLACIISNYVSQL